jgi:hypothetical protein
MDDTRDIQEKTDNLQRFFDQSRSRVNPFGENRSGERAYQKIERIAAALYLLTKHVSENEPVRILVRKNSLLLLDLMLSMRDEMRSVDSTKVSLLRSKILYTISLVRTLAVSGFISTQNAEIVIEALNSFADLIASSQRSALSESLKLSQSDFDIQGQTSIGQGQDRLKDLRDRLKIKDVLMIKDRRNASVSGSGITKRKENIMAILRSGQELGIKDIASNIPEYSEKMIQRELADLVALGFVKKTGLKRWSKYSIPRV